MDFKERTKKIKTWVNKNKGRIILGLGLAASVVIATIVTKSKTEHNNNIGVELEPPADYDCGKDLEMHFINPENGEILWKELCTESYMNDSKDSGMLYEAIRELNGIKEEA